jgi:hypothetical protein
MPEVIPQMLTKLLVIKIRMRALRKTPMLMSTLKELRCEGVEFNVMELALCKEILAHPRLRIFCEMG